MPIRSKKQNTLYLDDWNAVCDVCGFKFKASDLRERWDGLIVCQEDYERRHISDFYKTEPEIISVPYTSPDDSSDAADAWVSNNSILYSQQLDENEALTEHEEYAIWKLQLGCTVVANATNDPDGNATADRVVGDSTQEASGISQSFLSDGLPVAVSFYVKQDDADYCEFTVYDTDTDQHHYWMKIHFSGSEVSEIEDVVKLSSKSTSSFELVGNGWARIKVVVWGLEDTIGNLLSFLFYPETSEAPPAPAGNSTYLWGAQWEKHSYKVHDYLATTNEEVETDWIDTL